MFMQQKGVLVVENDSLIILSSGTFLRPGAHTLRLLSLLLISNLNIYQGGGAVTRACVLV